MEDWLKRVEREREKLQEKIDKLAKYPRRDALMNMQLHTMEVYCDILRMRIEEYYEGARQDG